MATPTPAVKTQSGTVTGYYGREGEIAVFKGIPFARPPVRVLSRSMQKPEIVPFYLWITLVNFDCLILGRGSLLDAKFPEVGYS